MGRENIGCTSQIYRFYYYLSIPFVQPHYAFLLETWLLCISLFLLSSLCPIRHCVPSPMMLFVITAKKLCALWQSANRLKCIFSLCYECVRIFLQETEFKESWPNDKPNKNLKWKGNRNGKYEKNVHEQFSASCFPHKLTTLETQGQPILLCLAFRSIFSPNLSHLLGLEFKLFVSHYILFSISNFKSIRNIRKILHNRSIPIQNAEIVQHTASQCNQRNLEVVPCLNTSVQNLPFSFQQTKHSLNQLPACKQTSVVSLEVEGHSCFVSGGPEQIRQQWICTISNYVELGWAEQLSYVH